jgi:hypothetical protein
VRLGFVGILVLLDSVLCNMVVLMFRGQLTHTLEWVNVAPLLSAQVLPTIVNAAFCGIATSLFLKYLDSVRKAIASAMELVFIALASAGLFGHAIDPASIGASFLVGGGIYLYSTNIGPEASESEQEMDAEAQTELLPRSKEPETDIALKEVPVAATATQRDKGKLATCVVPMASQVKNDAPAVS